MEELVRRGYEVTPIFSFNISPFGYPLPDRAVHLGTGLENYREEPFTTLQQVNPLGQNG